MDLNRRGLLKLFGAGASIVPLVGGEVVRAAEAKIIEPPKVDGYLAGPWDERPLGRFELPRLEAKFTLSGQCFMKDNRLWPVSVQTDPGSAVGA